MRSSGLKEVLRHQEAEERERRNGQADGRGTLFDPAVANALLENFETALTLRNAEGRVSDSSLARLVESSLERRAA